MSSFLVYLMHIFLAGRKLRGKLNIYLRLLNFYRTDAVPVRSLWKMVQKNYLSKICFALIEQ